MIRNTHSRLRVLRWRGLRWRGGGHIDQKYSLQAEGFTVEGVGGHIDQKYSLQAEGFTVEGVGGSH